MAAHLDDLALDDPVSFPHASGTGSGEVSSTGVAPRVPRPGSDAVAPPPGQGLTPQSTVEPTANSTVDFGGPEWAALRDGAPVHRRSPVWVDPRNKIVVRGGFDVRRVRHGDDIVTELTVRVGFDP